MEREIQRFLTHFAAERLVTANTITAYRNDLAQFCEYFPEHGLGLLVDEIEPQHLRGYMTYLHSEELGYANATVARKTSAVKTFLRYLFDNGVVDTDLTLSLPTPRVKRTVPHILSVEEVDRLLQQPLCANTPAAIRDHAMLEFLYATGVLVSEFIALNLDSIEVHRERVRVRCIGKRDRPRLIPIHTDAVLALHRYLEESRPALCSTPRARNRRPDNALFVNAYGQRLTRQGIWKLLKDYAKQADLPGVTPNTIRHSFAAHLLSGQMSISGVQALLGHRSISTTQIYASAFVEHSVAEAYEQAHPRA